MVIGDFIAPHSISRSEKSLYKERLTLLNLITHRTKSQKNNRMKQMLNDLNVALPHDLILDILLRLPAKPLGRFKCVSTSWRSLISSPLFVKLHRDASPITHRLLLKRINDGSEAESFDLQASSLSDPFAIVNLQSPAPYFMSLGSCRGFMLLTKKKVPSLDDLIVWNPSTGAHKNIPLNYDHWDSWYAPLTLNIPPLSFEFSQNDLYGFGYDSSNHHYLLVVIRVDDVLEPQPPTPINRIGVLSLKTNLPSFYGDEIHYMSIGPWAACGVYLSHSLHWSVTSWVTDHDVIISFDLLERGLLEIPLSPDLEEELLNYDTYHLSELGGCLCISYSGEDLIFPKQGGGDPNMAEIWVMKEYKMESSWTKSFVVSVNTLRFYPIMLTEGGGVIGSDDVGGLHKFNDRGELLENHAFGIEGENWLKYCLKYFDMYRDSPLTLGDFEEENEDA